ncbi:hypothetical protein AWJ20_2045 [Sugiyamaella lignohabitans]|uniref:Uncharacterized protein n=1 Tax=Sugiyamaella lignohabitans TaxID=796027 RepID=A0A167EU21_9ASCO|nr:uncharacterized protein AWJ20_2045 [Sugiyamaella lignohabitans]ANB14455.1 hypothetical protein AWJ20_2045 [Sugiyamaella lignohabitans]
MPPKTSAAELTIRLKHKKQTVLLILAGGVTVNGLKKTLAKALNETRGSDQGVDEVDDAPIPKPSFETASDVEEDTDKQPGAEEITAKIIDANDLRVGIPVDKSDFSKGFTDITDAKGNIEANGIVEGSILAFCTKDGDFEIEVPYDDNLDE